MLFILASQLTVLIFIISIVILLDRLFPITRYRTTKTKPKPKKKLIF